jgi:hypothetical protein
MHAMKIAGPPRCRPDHTVSLQNIAAYILSALHITCINCTSPKIDQLAVLPPSKESGEVAMKAVNTIIDLTTKMLGGKVLSVTN